jgi:hypothetical protein
VECREAGASLPLSEPAAIARRREIDQRADPLDARLLP